MRPVSSALPWPTGCAAAGHDVTRLVRRPAQAADEVTWQPSQGRLDPATVAGGRRGDQPGRGRDRRQTLERPLQEPAALEPGRQHRHDRPCDRNSRPPTGPRTLLQASAVGWYGDTGDREVTEDEPAGRTFLADLCRVWEAAARPAEDAGTRVVLMRTGLLLDAAGGLLKPLLLPFKLGGGAKLDSGRQWMPWIALAGLAGRGRVPARRTTTWPAR